MRIGMITGEYPPMEGGVGDFTHELSRALHAQGHEIHILTTSLSSTPPYLTENGLNVYRQIDDWGWGIHTRINQWVEAVKPELLNLQYQAAAYQMKGQVLLYPRQRSSAIPLVVTYHDLLPPYLFPKAGPLRQWSVRQLAQRSDGVIVTNPGDYDTLTQQFAHLATPMQLIPIGSNIAPEPPPGYTPADWRAAHGFAPEDLLIGFFGFLNRSKGVETLLEALSRLRAAEAPAHLLFIGGRTGTSDVTNAAYADEIDHAVVYLDLEEYVHHTGFAAPAEVSAALLAVDVCALPYRDGASLRHGTLHAALAHGCAIVTTTPQDEMLQLRDDENVVLFPPDDPAALTEAIHRLWRDPEARARLGRGAVALAQEFSWDAIAARTAAFFATLTATPGGSARTP